jgi:tRNA pseudouridine13 synthase
VRETDALERATGVEWFVSDAEGVGGRLRERPADFQVRELEAFDVAPVDADPGSYAHLVCRVTLRGWDTNDFAARLANAIGMSRERVSWAGTKDKRAVTTQLFSLQGVDPEAVPTVRDADVEVVGRAGRPIFFGDLAGNAFEVIVRAPDRPDAAETVRDELAAFAVAGDPDDMTDDVDAPNDTVAVPNWFGVQRFGSMRPVTHKVGLDIVRGDWEEAVLTYVASSSEREPEDTREARTYVEQTRDFTGALDRLPNRLRYERAMCHELDGVEDPDPADYRRALEAVPTNLQRLFVNAAQSYLFNRMLSERLRRGLPLGRPVVGDVVAFADRDAPEGLTLPDTDRLQSVTDRRVENVARHCERGRAFVTAPLVGTDTDLAGGEQGEIERSVLSAVDLSPADFSLPGEFGSTGTRRATLVRTDLELTRPADDRKENALALSFSLPRGSYATALLREFLKGDPADLG